MTPAADTALKRAASRGFDDYDPRLVIAAVNALQPRGDAALSVVDDFLAGREGTEPAMGLFWVLRVLMEMPGWEPFPAVAIGTPTVDPPANPGRLPRFPIVVVDDIPFLTVRGYVLGGLAQPVEDHVLYYRSWGSVRPSPLAPPPSFDGLEERFRSRWDDAYQGSGPTEGPAVVSEQLARMGAAGGP